MSEKGGFNLNISGDVKGDVAQSIDKSQHQTTNIAGDMHGDVNNSQGTEQPEWADVEALVGNELLDDVTALRGIVESGEDVLPPDGVLDRIYAASPDALELAGELIAKGPAGMAGLAVKKIGEYIKSKQEK